MAIGRWDPCSCRRDTLQAHSHQRPSPFAVAQGVGEKQKLMPTVISPTASDGTASVPNVADELASAQDGAW